MATNCSWCGRKISFFDLSYTFTRVNNKEYCICGECSQKISAAQKEIITFEEIKKEATVPELFNHLAGPAKSNEEIIKQRKIKQDQQQIKDDARKVNPLYDDIHQIAQDLRFIKNYLIFCIVAGILLALIFLANTL